MYLANAAQLVNFVANFTPTDEKLGKRAPRA